MCGIAGIVGESDPASSERAVLEALSAISHRGPDFTGSDRVADGAVGMCRLSIIDLEHGTQPVYSEDGRVVAVFNGEIYNYVELAQSLAAKGHRLASHSDSEVIPHLFEEYGVGMFAHLDGMFAIAIYDNQTRELHLARDRFGKKPLYFSSLSSGGLGFASEIKGLKRIVQANGGRLHVSDQAVADFFAFGVVPQPRTIYSEISCVEPGTVLSLKGGRQYVNTYWSPRFSPKVKVGYDMAAERTRKEIATATRKRLRADVPVGVFLSGGVDSTIVAYEVAQSASSEVESFTVKVADGKLDESPVAARTAARLGLRNHVLPLTMDPVELVPELVSHYDQPFADSSAIPSMQISKLAAQHVKVVLNGDGGDELFAGYRRHLAARQIGRLDSVPDPVKALLAAGSGTGTTGQRRSLKGFVDRFRRGLAMSPSERYLAWTTDMLRARDMESVWKGPRIEAAERVVSSLDDPSLSSLDRQLMLDTKINLLSDLLVKMDMATMLHSVEGRSPLLDHHVAEWAFRLPDHYKVRGGTTKAVLKHAYRDRIPTEVLSAPKRGFEVPVAHWLQNDLRPMVMDMVLASDSRIGSYFDRDFISGVVGGRMMGERNTTYLVYSFLIFELWMRENGA